MKRREQPVKIRQAPDSQPRGHCTENSEARGHSFCHGSSQSRDQHRRSQENQRGPAENPPQASRKTDQSAAVPHMRGLVGLKTGIDRIPAQRKLIPEFFLAACQVSGNHLPHAVIFLLWKASPVRRGKTQHLPGQQPAVPRDPADCGRQREQQKHPAQRRPRDPSCPVHCIFR